MQGRFEGLNPEIILLIFRYLSLTDIFALQIVCKKFNNALTGQYAPKFWEYAFRRSFGSSFISVDWLAATRALYKQRLRQIRKDLQSTHANNLLTDAIQKDRAFASELIKLGFGINNVNANGCTAIYVAAECGELSKVKDLMCAGADVRSMLMLAVANKAVKVVYHLLSVDELINKATLVACAKTCSNPEIQYLIEAMNDFGNERHLDYKMLVTVLIFAITNNDLEFVESFLDSINSGTIDKAWNCASNFECVQGLVKRESWSTIEALIMTGLLTSTSPLWKKVNNKFLREAAKTGNTNLAKILLDFHADISMRDCEGQTALHVAIEHKHWPITYLFLIKMLNDYVHDRKTNNTYPSLFMIGDVTGRATRIRNAEDLIAILQAADTTIPPCETVRQNNFALHGWYDAQSQLSEICFLIDSTEPPEKNHVMFGK